SMKEYDPGIFADFGLVIYDECHHVASRVFSNALAKTGAKYTLGLSATPIRLDGLTRVIHWYVGEFIHREESRKNKQVIAKVFHYVSNNLLFREKKRWFKGGIKPDTVKMISNFCDLEERSKHVIDIVNELRVSADRKILVLSGRVAHLTELKNAVDKAIGEDIDKGVLLVDECRTYFYTGASKKKERQEAESNGDILFATFELAHEGLDIERLNTIILATPKKNIIQAVGRIMRKILTAGDVRPLIIDFSDEVSVFSYQSEARIAQYMKNKYKVEHYYLKNDKIITFDTYMQQQQNMTQEEILEMVNRVVYEPKLGEILNMQRVEYEVADEVVVEDEVVDNRVYLF
ncbi:MAG: superfamily II DNA or RNA helicase, partial [Hyperionvirus sp.]